jgi:hypothetical protein
MSLFGKGGKLNQDTTGLTGPVPLDVQNSKPNKFPSGLGLGNASSYQNSQEGSKRVKLTEEYSDMSEADEVEDERIKSLRIESYKLVNEEKKLDIKNKHEFSQIAKITTIVLACLLVFSFIVYFLIFSLISVKTGSIAENGIFGNILDTFISIIKMFL